MRRVKRRDLPPPTPGALDRRQQKADQKRNAAGTLNVQSTWNSARKTKPLATVFKTLKEMAGERERFPLDANGLPLLVDPSAANPWDFLDFNPDIYNFVARFDLATNAPSAHGATTVDLLQLDRREALEAGYRKTHKRILALAACVTAFT